MFKEFNVEFQDVEMIGGADNLLENTKVTKVVMSGDNKMSSLDSAFKNCSELDNIQGGLDLNGVSNIDNILDGNNLIKNIDLKNVNNENISASNPFTNVAEINIGGELYNKKAIQNVIASKDWAFDNINYSDTVEENIIEKSVNVVVNNKITISDTLEQKAKGIEIIGQTYENLVDGKGEHKLTDTFSTTWTESNNSIDNPPSMIEVPEIWGNTIQDETDLSNIQSVGDLYVDEEGTPILDEEGNEQYKLELISNDGNNNSNKTTILMPQPLRRVNNASNYGSVSIMDELVYENGKYYIKQRIDVLDLTSYAKTSDVAVGASGRKRINLTIDKIYAQDRLGVINITLRAICTGFAWGNAYSSQTDCVQYSSGADAIQFNVSSDTTGAQLLERLKQSNAKFYIPLGGSTYTDNTWSHPYNLIETKILEKPSLETYSPKTYISANTEVQPSQMSIVNKKTSINLKELNTNTDYTIQFKCNEKSDNPIKFNLCGTEKEVNMPIGVNHVSITTSNSLTNNQLELSGDGNTISDVMVVKGEMNQYPEYFEGIANAGELQDDGSYRVGIKSNEGFNVSIISNNPLVKGDKLYWNKTNKRYEIDRNGEIEIPIVNGDVIDLPRLYQRKDTVLTIESGNINPSSIKVEYLDID